MKKIASILVFVFTITTQAQRDENHEKEGFTIEQETNLAVKKMTLALDLSEKQQNEIKPLISKKIAAKKASMENRKTAKENRKRPTSDELYAGKSKMLDSKIAMKKKMKKLLSKEQFAKFKKMQKGRKMKGKKHRKNKEHKCK